MKNAKQMRRTEEKAAKGPAVTKPALLSSRATELDRLYEELGGPALGIGRTDPLQKHLQKICNDFPFSWLNQFVDRIPKTTTRPVVIGL